VTDAVETARFMAMKGSGYYSKATIAARDAIDAATPWVLEAVNRLPLGDDGSPVRVADLGCADGGTSVGLWHRVLPALRQRVPGRAIEIIYTDLPQNDFSQLFRMLHGQTVIESYYGQIPDVYPFASATSFHQAIFPPGSVHLAFSAHASHYISKVPCPLSEHVHMVGATEIERADYEDTGRLEWERLLALRARELVPGGRLCMMSFGIDDDGRHLGHTGGVSIFDTFNTLWRQLADEGIISHDEYRRTNFPQVLRTTEQFTSPLRDEKCDAWAAGLRLESIEWRTQKCPFARSFEEHRDPERFAREYVPTLRSWSEATFANGLSSDRSPHERLAVLDELYGRYEQLVAKDPEGHGMDLVDILMTCVKA
jgi:hypothetical protein